MTAGIEEDLVNDEPRPPTEPHRPTEPTQPTGPTEPIGPTEPTGSGPGRLRALVLAALVLVAAVAIAVRAWTWQADADDLAQARTDRAAAVAVAERAAGLLVQLDGETGADTLAELRGLATGDFATQVDTLADTVAGVLAQGRVSSQGEVAAAAVESAEPGRATVLIAATALVSNTELPDGELRTFRMAVEVARVAGDPDGAWQVSDVEFLG